MENIIFTYSEQESSNAHIFTDPKAWEAEWQHRLLLRESLATCKRCLYDESIPGLRFNAEGICHYCEKHDELMRINPGGDVGLAQFEKIVKEIKLHSKRKPYDVIVGVSGGADSSYLVHLARSYDLKVLAVHFDNTWNSQIATENIKNVLKHLGVELWTHVVNNREFDDVYRAMFKAGVPDIDAPVDLALAATLNQAAQTFGIKYVFEGHCFKTEGLFPTSWNYMDSKYVSSIHQAFGNIRKTPSLPKLWLSTQLKWMLVNRLKKIRPLWLIDYEKQKTIPMLEKNYGWKWYGGHHLENRTAAFYHTYVLPRRYNVDTRINTYSALVRSGHCSREDALNKIEQVPHCDRDLYSTFVRRLCKSEDELVEWMMLPIKTYRDYPSYKPTFEKYRWFFYAMAQCDLIPWSFYIKYTSKNAF